PCNSSDFHLRKSMQDVLEFVQFLWYTILQKRFDINCTNVYNYMQMDCLVIFWQVSFCAFCATV
ncbi:MAG: hypothetical protein K1W06_00665, partial [Lachnospiraceae bacterium]